MDKQVINKRKIGILAFVLIKLIRLYQFLTPFLNCCRFHPTCSEYSAQAIEKHGVIKGIFLTSYRILRCQPYCKAGYDPVPERINFNILKREKLKQNNV